MKYGNREGVAKESPGKECPSERGNAVKRRQRLSCGLVGLYDVGLYDVAIEIDEGKLRS